MKDNRAKSLNGLQKFVRNAPMKLQVGLIVLILLALFSIVVPLRYPGDPTLTNQVPAKIRPNAQYLLGTTTQGQDVLALLGYALRNSLIIGVLVAAIGSAIGVIWGMLAGFLGGGIDNGMMLVTDTFLVIPSLPVMILYPFVQKYFIGGITVGAVKG